MASTESPTGPHLLKASANTCSVLTHVLSQLQDIDPSRLSFSPFLDLDTQISLAPVSDSPESSVEELRSTEEEEEEEEDREWTLPSRPVEVFPQCMGSGDGAPALHSVTQEAAALLETTGSSAGERAAVLQEGDNTVSIRMPQETSFLGAAQPPPRCLLRAPEPAADLGQSNTHELIHQSNPPLEEGGTNPISGDPALCPRDGDSRCCRSCSSDHMKAVASAFVSLLLAPWFLYGCYYFLPFQDPTCPDLASRIAFALHYLLIAGLPILLGMALRGISALCSDGLGPLDAHSRSVQLHQLFVFGSVDQFIVFGLNLVVSATFLPQEHLRLVPILVGLFSIGRCCYWASVHLCGAYRGFGFGLSFFLTLALTAYNLFCLYQLGFGFLSAPTLPAGDVCATPTPMLELTIAER
ncbi:uncharacterized protein LOC134413177 [Elgaria multicarinata webbii]|uniref:uncharacterized protein LOC134413177 n=1 Tax=Elgaria multicarinata webbii TaxID=159646 RepID=UPI002FCD3EE1